MQIFCDFDGTVSVGDATDHVLVSLADDEWTSIEELWKQGLIGSRECMQRQIELIRGGQAALDAVLDRVEIDPGFAAFTGFCRAARIPVTIVSDGVDYFIRRILANHGIADLPILANHLVIEPDGFTLQSPNAVSNCKSQAGTCKCAVVSNCQSRTVFVGDGRSDFCVINKPDVVFAKTKLAEYCADNGIAYTPYKTFHDITSALEAMISKQSHRVPTL